MEAQSSVSVVAPPRPPRGESATCEPQQVDPARRPSQNGERTKAGVCARKSAATTVKHGYAHGGSAANAAVAATGAHVIGGWTAPQGYPGQAGAAAVTPYAAAGAGTAGHAAALTPGHGGADKSRELFPTTPATATGTAPAAPPGTVATRAPTGPGGGTAATTPATGAAAAAATTVRRFWGRPLVCNFVFTICWLTLSSFLRERLVLAGTPFSPHLAGSPRFGGNAKRTRHLLSRVMSSCCVQFGNQLLKRKEHSWRRS